MSTTTELYLFERDMLSWNASDRTIRERMSTTRSFLGQRNAADITSADVSAWLSRPHLAPWSRVTYHGHLAAFYRWALTAGIVDSDPVAKVRRPRPPRGRPRPLHLDDFELVMSTSTGHLHTWYVLAAFAGLRAHEIAKIKGDDLDERTLFVLGKGRQEAYIPTHPLVWAEAAKYSGRGYWFPSSRSDGHISPLSVSQLTSRHFRSHEIEGSIHRLRHTYGTRLLRQGTNIRVVQTLMRHASLQSTALYTEVDDDERRSAVLGLSA